MSSQSDEATVESEETVSEEAREQVQPEKPGKTFLADLLKDAVADGHTIADPTLLERVTEPSETEETEPVANETESTEEIEEAAEEEEQETEVEPVKGEHKSIDDQIKEFTAKGEKPPWYLSRIAEESQKRRERTDERDKAVERVKELEAQVAAKSAPQPNGKDPLADIFDEVGLSRMKGVYQRVIKLAELNPEGVFDEPWKKADGTEEKVSLTREQLIDMKLEAQDMLTNGIPARRQYIANRGKGDAIAREKYPELADDDSGWKKLGQQFLSTVPELQRDPEVWLWIARAIRGLQWELSQTQRTTKAKPNPKETASKIVESSRTKKAPVTPTARGFVRRSGADLEKARKELKEKGDAASAEKYLESLGVGGRRSSKPALIES